MSQIFVEVQGDRIAVHIDYIEADAVMAIPGSRWRKHDDPQYSVGLTFTACIQLRGVFGDRLSVGPELAQWSVDQLTSRVAPSLAERLSTDYEHGDPRLRGFQRAGVHWMNLAGDCLLGDDLGSGKTVQTCIALKEQGLKRGVIVAPKSTLGMWVEHLEEWAGLNAVVVAGTPTHRKKALKALADGEFDVAVIGWQTVREHSRVSGFGDIQLTTKETTPKELDNLGLEFVVADEAHMMREPRSIMTRAVWNLSDLPTMKRRIALTGTPIGNRLDELWSVMRFVSPGEWPVKTKHVDRYCEIGWNQWGGRTVGGLKPATREEFFKILDPRYRAMTKDVVLPDLPPITGGLDDPTGPLIRECEMTPKQRKAYEQLAEKSIAELESGILVAGGSLARAGRLMAFASSFADVEDYEDDGKIKQRLTLLEPSCKLDGMEELLEGELAGEEAVVIFTVSRQLAVMAQARAEKVTKRPSLLIMGGQTADQRTQYINQFQQGRAGTIIVTIKAGGAGITLTRARASIYLQRDFSYIASKQSEGRTHRIGSEVHDRVFYYDLVTKGTREDRVLKALAEKRELAEELSRPDILRELLLS